MRSVRIITTFLFAITLTGLVGCQTEPKTEAGKANLHDEATTVLNAFEREDPSLRDFMQRAHGYAIFPSVGKGGLGIGGAYGHGEVYERGQRIGYSDITQATIGLQAGGQSFSELIVFENAAALDRFKTGKFSFSANASAIAVKSGAAGSANFKDGMAVFVKPQGGLMFEASIGGQEFSYKPLSEADRDMNSRTETRTTTEVQRQ